MPKLDRIDPNVLQHNPRCNLSSWLRYRDLAFCAFRLFPKTHIFKPSSLRASTVASRFRDACRGAIAFEYNIDSEITAEEFASWFNKIVVKHDTDHVYIGPPSTLLPALAGDQAGAPKNGLTFPLLSFEEISAFTLLLSAGHLTGPITILSPPDISLLPPRPNVEIWPKDDGSLMLL